MADQTPNPFDLLPIETNQHIASYLDSDAFLCNFRRISHSTHNAVDGDRLSFWRRRFLARFEKPTWTEPSNLKYKHAYQKRRKALMYGAKFDAAVRRTESKEIKKANAALEVVRDILVDSFSEKKEGDDKLYDSTNLELALQFITNHDLLDIVCLPEAKRTRDVMCVPKQLLLTVQVMLAPAMFDLDRNFGHWGFPDSQEAVYGTVAQYPIFGGANGLDVNMEWVLHHINFWKYHMVRETECTLFEAFKALDDDEKPRFWDSQLKQGGNKLGVHWKGSYAYVDRDVIDEIRKGKGADGMINDEFNGEAGNSSFQDVRLEMVDEDAVAWPAVFEEHLQSLTAPPSRAKTRAQRRSGTPDSVAAFKPQNFQFLGEGNDVTEEFLAQGWLNALPPQQSVPGWQRMTMMKYFEDPDTGHIDPDALWAYEGIVLPGGQIMLGRWWSPSDGTGASMYSGPFILWCVDGPKFAEAETEDEDNMP